MKGMIISMAVFVAVLSALVLRQGTDAYVAALKESGVTFVKFFPVMLVAFLLMGLAQAVIPKSLAEEWLSDSSGWRGIGVAWLAGALTPAGSIMGMPLAAGLLKAGAGVGVIVTYLTSLAVLSIARMPLEVGFYGWRLMVIRLLACALLPPIAGLIARGAARALLPEFP